MTNHPLTPVYNLAIRLIADKENWIKGTYAMTTQGAMTAASDELATKFCCEGAVRTAILRTYPNEEREPYLQPLMTAFTRLRESYYEKTGKYPSLYITNWNDSKRRKHSEVIALLKDAYASAQELDQPNQRKDTP